MFNSSALRRIAPCSSTEERSASNRKVASSNLARGTATQLGLPFVKTCYRCKVRHENSQQLCRSCYNEYMRGYLNRRWLRRRARAIETLGGMCTDCGTIEQLEFDHVDRALKSFSISSRPFCSEEKFWQEIAKCVLRCTPCHRKRSADQRRIDHGAGRGKRGCCEPCDKRYREYNLTYNEKRRHRAPVPERPIGHDF